MGLPGEPSGTRLGKYQLLRRLATGGMAEIFLARAQSIHGFEKQVVLKRILPQHASSDDFIRMFLAEARLAATLHHPNIVQVYDIGEEAGAYFFTMEYIEGEDLRRLVRAARHKQTPIPLAHILHVIMGMAGGLHHAHEKIGTDGLPLGIVHRDVSPSNVLVTYEGDVKVVDFGIAKAAAAQNSTIAGTLKGKIPYMSPEQCRGELVDRRSDIFSIGTLLWELTTGKRLFAGENEFAILNRVAKADVPPPSSVRPEYPPELEAIVMRALSRDPDNRYATAIDLQIDIEDFAREARLPVSSARMGRFMRALFEEELKAAAAERFAVPASTEVPGSTMIVSPSSPPEGFSDLTPSEVRLHGEPTPGLGSGIGGSGTDISYPEHSEPAPVRRNPAVALGAGFLLTLGLGGGAYMAFGGGGKAVTAAEDAQEVAPKRKIEAVAVEPYPSETPPTELSDDAAEAKPEAPLEQPGADPAADPALVDSGGDPQGSSLAEDATPEEPEADDPPATDSAKARRLPRKAKKPAKPATEKDPVSESTKKPRYDENSARLPGM